MNSEAFSLSKLRDIIVPDPPSFWPPAPGAWLALAVITSVLLLVGRWGYVAWKRNAYRRAGVALLDTANTVHDVSVVLKRVALVAYPREQVAPLYGQDWVNFLNNTCSRSSFTPSAMSDAVAPAMPDLIELAATWIRYHQVPKT